MLESPVAKVRRFNRTLTQRIGVLQQSYLSRGRPLGEARLLYEIGDQGADLRTLRDRLSLDSGYLSRLLRSLERQGLVEAVTNSADARRRKVRLTAAGNVERQVYDSLADAFAETLLNALPPEGQERLVSAMADVERLMSASAMKISVERPDSEAAIRCSAHYFGELAQRFEGGFDQVAYLSRSPATDYQPPSGYFLIAWLDAEPVGCGALKIYHGTGEIRRVWTAPAARGLGVARSILRKIEGLAADAGASALRLSTNRALEEAQGLYRASGFQEVAPFDDDPFSHHWFEKALEGPRRPSDQLIAPGAGGG